MRVLYDRTIIDRKQLPRYERNGWREIPGSQVLPAIASNRGKCWVQRPVKKYDGSRLSVYCPERLRDEVSAAANEAGVSVSEAARSLIAEQLARKGYGKAAPDA